MIGSVLVAAPEKMDGLDIARMNALKAIAEIALRPRPEDAHLVTFHESFKSDAALVRRFCRNRAVFGRTSKSLDSHWEAVNYLSDAHFLYYLPALLQASLEYPNGTLASLLLAHRLPRLSDLLTDAEKNAVASVEEVLRMKGVTRDSIARSIERGKQLCKDIKEMERQSREEADQH